jgi:NAD(P)-dependent dehydrogenase (short-subunit alcohol dehydrogenase family)
VKVVADRGQGAVVFGAKRLGRGIARHLVESGWHVAAAARTASTIDSLAAELPAVHGAAADLGEPGAADAVLADAWERLGGVDLVVNAIADPQVSASALSREAEGGAHLKSSIGAAVGPVHHVVEASVRRLREQGNGCFIQITGGLALRAQPGTGALAATGFATRALVEGAVPEAREDGVHLALLVIRGLIESDLTAETLEGKPAGASMTGADVAAAIDFLAGQDGTRAWTHELVLTPPRARWQG